MAKRVRGVGRGLVGACRGLALLHCWVRAGPARERCRRGWGRYVQALKMLHHSRGSSGAGGCLLDPCPLVCLAAPALQIAMRMAQEEEEAQKREKLQQEWYAQREARKESLQAEKVGRTLSANLKGCVCADAQLWPQLGAGCTHFHACCATHKQQNWQ